MLDGTFDDSSFLFLRVNGPAIETCERLPTHPNQPHVSGHAKFSDHCLRPTGDYRGVL